MHFKCGVHKNWNPASKAEESVNFCWDNMVLPLMAHIIAATCNSNENG